MSCYPNKEVWAAAILKVFNGPESEIEENVLKLYSRDVTVTANGTSMKFDGFLEYVKSIRAQATSVSVVPHYFLRDGNLFADKHTTIGTLHDGSKTRFESLLIGELNEEGKCFWIEEISRLAQEDSGTATGTTTES